MFDEVGIFSSQNLIFFAAAGIILLTVLVLWSTLRVRQRRHIPPPFANPNALLEREIMELRRALADEKARTEQALSELGQQKEITKIAVSISDEQANKLRIFSRMADELRIPLTLTIGPIENALEGKYGEVAADLKRQLEVMLRNVHLLSRLLSGYHDISKLQARSMELHIGRRNLVRFLKDIVVFFEPYAKKKKMNLNFSADKDEIEAYFDAEKMAEVICHLLSNAFRFTPQEGTITLSVAEKVLPDVAEGEWIEIRVEDTGKGIPKEKLTQIFDVLRSGTEQTDELQGPRVGLSLVRDLLSLHGGDIEVLSEVGRGTKFVIALRIGKGHLADLEVSEDVEVESEEISQRAFAEIALLESGNESELEAVEIKEMREEEPEANHILIVEDNADVRELLRDSLKDSYHVTEAINGKDALEKVRKTPPDLIISDILMPGMDGFDLCRTIKTDSLYSHIPVILLSARASEVMRIQGLQAGADAYIPKPFSPQELIAKIRSLSRTK